MRQYSTLHVHLPHPRYIAQIDCQTVFNEGDSTSMAASGFRLQRLALTCHLLQQDCYL